MEAKLLELVSSHFGMPEAELTSEMELKRDLNATELEIADFFQALENTFSITISKEDAMTLHTLGDVIAYLSDHVE